MKRGNRVLLACVALLACVCAEDAASSVVIDPETAEMQQTQQASRECISSLNRDKQRGNGSVCDDPYV